jgi:hypothetical protein
MVCHYAETRNLFIAMPNAIILSVFRLNVVMLNVIMLSVAAPKDLRTNVVKCIKVSESILDLIRFINVD